MGFFLSQNIIKASLYSYRLFHILQTSINTNMYYCPIISLCCRMIPNTNIYSYHHFTKFIVSQVVQILSEHGKKPLSVKLSVFCYLASFLHPAVSTSLCLHCFTCSLAKLRGYIPASPSSGDIFPLRHDLPLQLEVIS